MTRDVRAPGQCGSRLPATGGASRRPVSAPALSRACSGGPAGFGGRTAPRRPVRHRFGRLAASLLLAVLTLLAAPALRAADYYVAAGTETETRTGGGNGSAAAPWPSVKAGLASGRLSGGDRLLLQPGNHGNLAIRGQSFDPPLTIASAPGGRAHVEKIWVHESRGLIIEGLDVWPLAPRNYQERGPGPTMVEATRASSHITFADLDIRGAPDAPDRYFQWERDEWVHDWRAMGVIMNGPDQTLRDSRLTGISNGIQTDGPRAQVLDNQVRGFSKDGMRGFGEGSVFRGNLVQDCFQVDGNHADAFQAWTDTPKMGNRRELRNLSLIDNTIIEWTGPAGHPLRCKLQGIALFRGPYKNWIISNNLIAVRAPHGIALYGGQTSEITNNTVVQIDGESGKAPWIMIKDVTGGAFDNIVANNAAMKFQIPAGTAVQRNNVVIRSAAQLFVDVPGQDFRPRSGSMLVGAADPAFGDTHDLSGRQRPARPAVGAYEAPP